MQNRYFPFNVLGFHCNPFRALTEDEWSVLAVVPPEINEVVRCTNSHLQLLGDAGHGKSTLLRGLKAQLQAEGKHTHFEYLPLGQRHLKTPSTIIADVDVFLLDEAQRLAHRQRNKLFSLVTKHHVRLMMGSHEDFALLFEKHRQPLSTLVLDEIDEQLLAEMLVKRLDYFRADESPKVFIEADAICCILARFGRNLRHLEYYLYEVFQYLAEQRRIEPISASLLREIDPQLINLVGQE